LQQPFVCLVSTNIHGVMGHTLDLLLSVGQNSFSSEDDTALGEVTEVEVHSDWHGRRRQLRKSLLERLLRCHGPTFL
jgi:hypothetical protein